METFSRSEHCTQPISLSIDMINIIRDPSLKLEDEHINKYIELLERNTAFKMQTPLLYQVLHEITEITHAQKHIQILFSHMRNDQENCVIEYSKPVEGHWICSYYNNNIIYIYDSLNRKVLNSVESSFLKKLFPFNPKIIFKEVQQQQNSIDCGIFAIAFAVSLSVGRDPSTILYDQSKLRLHLYEMLINNVYAHFPYINDNLNRATFEENLQNRRQRLQIVSNSLCRLSRRENRIKSHQQMDVTMENMRQQSNIRQLRIDSTEQSHRNENSCQIIEQSSTRKLRLSKRKRHTKKTNDTANSESTDEDRLVYAATTIVDFHNKTKIYDSIFTKFQKQAKSGGKNRSRITSTRNAKKSLQRSDKTSQKKINHRDLKPISSNKINDLSINRKTDGSNITRDLSTQRDSNIPQKRRKTRIQKSKETFSNEININVRKNQELLEQRNANSTYTTQLGISNIENDFDGATSDTDTDKSSISEYSENEGRAYRVKIKIKDDLFLNGLNDIDTVKEESIVQHYIGKMNVVCKSCESLNFKDEQPSDRIFNKCCHKGKVKLPLIDNYPDLLRDLLTGKSKNSKHFKEHIRSYNNALAFASMGAKLEKVLGRGPFVFRIHGQVYHNTFAIHPNENEERKYAQLYVIDSQQANLERLNKECNSKCNKNLMEDLDKLIRDINPFAQAFHMMSDLEKKEQKKAELENRTIKPIRMWIKNKSNLDKNRFNAPTCNEVAVIFTSEDGGPPTERDICIHPKQKNPIPISNLSPNLDPMTYPLVFRRGEKVWTIGLKHCFGNRDITTLQYYSYRLASRKNFNPCLSAGKLTQQFIVDVWCKIEGERLKYLKQNQKELRSELYSGLMDYLQKKAVDNVTITPGRMVILPSSFQTSPRAYQQLFMDAMGLVQKLGKPQLFLTMTCNPNWPEITENLNINESPSDRPDLITRVFQMKVNQLKKLLLSSHIFGKHIAYIYVIEFQKRGLPHIHLLLFLEKKYIIRNTNVIDQIISAEIPNKHTNPRLYGLVKQFMVHGPCGKENDYSPCIDPKTKKCTKRFPKQFLESTTFSNGSYPLYRRRNNGRVICYRGKNSIRLADNTFIVPYNPFLLLNLNCHCNVEVCSTVQLIKYLFKYCYKGHDCAFVEIHDEISQYLSTRYVCPPEAMQRILELKMHEQSHTTIRLAVHLEKQQILYFHEGSEEQVIERHKNTTLTAWFELNKLDESAREFLYIEIPEHYIFNQTKKIWIKRSRKRQPIISRMYFVSPKEIERYHLRLLLLHVRGAKSFEELRSLDGVIYESFKEAARKWNLIENDDEIEMCLNEAINFKFPNELCRLLSYIFIFRTPLNGNDLWIKYKKNFLDPNKNPIVGEQIALKNIESSLKEHGYSLNDFGLPNVIETIIMDDADNIDERNTQQKNIEILKEEVIKLKETLNPEQEQVYYTVLNAVQDQSIFNRYFYLDGPGGTGKSYLLNTIIKTMECENRQLIVVAWTGIAANLLRQGRTVHSMFKLPMELNESTTCNITGTCKDATLIRNSELIIWDEITMSPKYALQAIDLLLRDLTKNNTPFGGKVVLLSGDWRQILPIVKHGTRTEIIEGCIKNSHLWKHFKYLTLTINNRIDGTQKEFISWLLKVGNGSALTQLEQENDIVEIPSELLAKTYITREIYGEIISKDDERVYNYSILSPINTDVFDINNEILKKLEGEEKKYLSIDTIESDSDSMQNSIPVEYMNSIIPSGFPPHNLVLKIGTIVMLLRNLNVSQGLCNGSRLVITHMLNNLIIAKIITGGFKGKIVLLPKIKLISSDNELPFKMVRKQFPIRVAYAMTINKAQGQTFDRVGIYLEHEVFSHGQLYVALSRVRRKENLRVSIVDTQNSPTYTKNVVFGEIFTK